MSCKPGKATKGGQEPHAPTQIVFIRDEYLTRLGNMPDLNRKSAVARTSGLCKSGRSYLGVLILDFCRRQELDGFPLEQNLDTGFSNCS